MTYQPHQSEDATTKPVATDTVEEARRGYAMRNGAKVYCCYGMYADVGHDSDCENATAKDGVKAPHPGDALGRCFDCVWAGKSSCPHVGVTPSDAPSSAEAMRLALAALEKSIDNFQANVQHRAAIVALRAALASGVAPTDQRQRFEAWADDQGFPLKRLDTSDGYLDLRTHGAWDAWQAATAGATPTGETRPQCRTCNDYRTVFKKNAWNETEPCPACSPGEAEYLSWVPRGVPGTLKDQP